MLPVSRVFHELHQSGCFVSPNPWDPGSARLLEGLGFRALATTSSGHAWSRGRRDHGISLAEALDALRAIVESVSLPVSADFEGGFAVEPRPLAANVAAACATGIAGLSIEDSTEDASQPLVAFELAVERIRAARAAIDAAGTGALLTARSEGFIAGRPDLRETVRRLQAYADAGADCLFAPGVRTREDLAAIVAAVAPRPVNVIAWPGGLTLSELAALGVRRISVGGALARAAWAGFMAAAREIADHGSFAGLARAIPSAEMEALLPR